MEDVKLIEMIELDARDREDYFRAVLNPPEPSKELREALAKYREKTAERQGGI